MNQTKILPGMVNNSVEIFVVENVVKAIRRGKVIDFTDLPLGIIQRLKEEINKDKQLKLALHDMHPDSSWKRLEQFAKCRFGGLDFQGDITEDAIQDGEYWDCPNRGNCAYEGIVCKLPMINNHRLTSQEIQLMQLSSSEKTNDVIAEEMNMPAGSFHKAKAILHSILGVQTKQGVTKACTLLNII